MSAADRLDALAAAWAQVMLRGLIESTVLLLVIGVLWFLLRRRLTAQASGALFLLVLLKLVVPGSIAVPAGWPSLAPAAIRPVWPDWPQTAGASVRLDRASGPAGARTERPAPAISSPARPGPEPAGTPGAAAWLMLGWAAVVLGLLASLVGRHVAMHRRLRGARAVSPGELPVDAQALARRAGLRGPVPLLEVPWIDSPAVWGLIRPRVLVPPEFGAAIPPAGMTWVLLHEFCHIRRRDAWVVLFQRLVQIVHFCHPAIWLASRSIDAFREYACDDAATALAGVSRRDCGAGFLAVVERACAAPRCGHPALGMLRSNTLIRSRLMRILEDRRPRKAGRSLGSAALVLAVAAVGLPRLRAIEEPAGPTAAVPGSRPTAAPAATVVSGVVRDRDGRPVAGVLIAGTDRRHEVPYRNGELASIRDHDGPFTESGADGRYRLDAASTRRPAPAAGAFGIFAVHERGYARRSAEELADTGDLTLEPWGRVVGTATVLGRPLANVPVRVMLDATDRHSMFYDLHDFEARTDAQGRFAVERVPAGVVMASTGTLSGREPGAYGPVLSARRPLAPGETLELNLGGAGRPVEGRIRVLEGIPVTLGGGTLALSSGQAPEPTLLRLDDGEPRSEESIDRVFRHNLEAYRSPAGLAHRLSQRFHPVQIRPDGTFQAVEVEPGTYRLAFWAGQDPEHPIATREVVVPPIPGGRTDAPLDLGMVTITPPDPR